MTDNPVKKSLQHLYDAIVQLAKDNLDLMSSLIQVAMPDSKRESRTGMLREMMSKVSKIIHSDMDISVLLYPPYDDLSLVLFSKFLKVKSLLLDMPQTALLNIGGKIPHGSIQQQTLFVSRIKNTLETLSNQRLRKINEAISTTPIHQIRSKLKDLEPTISPDAYAIMSEIVRMSIEDLLHFKNIFAEMDEEKLMLLVSLLNLDPAQLLDVRNRLTSTKGIPHTEPSYYVNFQPSENFKDDFLISDMEVDSRVKRDRGGISKSTINLLESGNIATYDDWNEDYLIKRPTEHFMTSEGYYQDLSYSSLFKSQEIVPVEQLLPLESSNRFNNSVTQSGPVLTQSALIYQPPNVYPSPEPEVIPLDVLPSPPQNQNPVTLKVVKQPPAKVVYLRLLKPPPSVMLLMSEEIPSNLFVQCYIERCDTGEILQNCLEGNCTMKIGSSAVQFKKLKIQATSLKYGTEFRLTFRLKRFIGDNVFEDLNIETKSSPINVVSHSQYLNNKANDPVLATISEVVPHRGKSGTRVAILGHNFVLDENLTVRFGSSIVKDVYFHENGTLVCAAPPLIDKELSVSVTVSNDGRNFAQSNVMYSYI